MATEMVDVGDTTDIGKIPAWLQQQLHKRTPDRRRLEIEVKFIVPRASLSRIMSRSDVTTLNIEQTYLPAAPPASLSIELAPFSDPVFTEWRLRDVDGACFLTAKSDTVSHGTERAELELSITPDLYTRISRVSEGTSLVHRIRKTRRRLLAPFAGEEVIVAIDDYHLAAHREWRADFLTCEIELPERRLATILLRGRFFAPDLLFLKQGCSVTGIREFSNRYLAEFGFVEGSFAGLLEWIRRYRLSSFLQRMSELTHDPMNMNFEELRDALAQLESSWPSPAPSVDSSHITWTQDVLRDLAFGIGDSLGRKDTTDPKLAALDALGKGWLRDYHVIISSNCYIRLHSKPQIFRPGLGYTNTTTRGAHTSDVIATATQLARQLGLNVELCMAAAALHDVGHPAGGHVGEKVLADYCGHRFEHHIFSLSLAEVFGLNLLREVMAGALYHKSGGRELRAPEGHPQEYGVVRLADKISYCPWDIFDSIENGYLSRGDLPSILFDVLGTEPVEWIWTLIDAAVRESATSHSLRFSARSGKVFEAYQLGRRIVYEQVHPKINWLTLEAQLRMCYDKLKLSFPELRDIVPLVAYITDRELENLARLIEAEPQTRKLEPKRLRDLGFGFCELLDRMLAPAFDWGLVYYEAPRGDAN